MNDEARKPCSRCGAETTTKHTWCRDCNRAHHRDWAAANRKQRNQYARERRAAGVSPRPCLGCGIQTTRASCRCLDCERAHTKAYRAANHERIAQHKKRAYLADRERELEKRKKNYAANRARYLEQKKEYYAANRARLRQKGKAYAAANLHVFRSNGRLRRAREKSVPVIAFTEQQWMAKVAYWGDRCWCCGGDWSAMDHVKPIAKGGSHMLCNLRPICQSCNSSKSDRWPLAA